MCFLAISLYSFVKCLFTFFNLFSWLLKVMSTEVYLHIMKVMSFDKGIHLCNYYHNQDITFVVSKIFLVPFCNKRGILFLGFFYLA